MGYGVVPNMKSEAVVCQKPCEHRDCASLRAYWTKRCAICKGPMIAGEAFYRNDNGDPEHRLCVMEQEAKSRPR